MRIGDLCTYAPKSQIKASEAVDGAEYMFFTSSADESKRYSDYQFDGEGIIMGTGGNATLHYYSGKYATSTDCVVLMPNEQVRCKYLYYFFKANMKVLEAGFKGAGLRHINKKYIDNICIKNIPNYRIQDEVIFVLDKLQAVINSRNEEQRLLDDLIKARFIEMFGDLETNPYGWSQVTVGDVCSSIVRGPFGSALKKEFFVAPSDTTYKVYEQKHAIQKSATIGTYYVTAEKFNELHRFECHSGDILMSCSGTMGELYQLPAGCERGIINQALCKFTLNDRILPTVFLSYMRETIGNLETKGSGIQNIAAVSYVKTMPINLPPMHVQKQFVDFVDQVDKSKAVIQKSLDETQLLFDSLMQKYFG